jgi:hypothetical protein
VSIEFHGKGSIVKDEPIQVLIVYVKQKNKKGKEVHAVRRPSLPSSLGNS